MKNIILTASLVSLIFSGAMNYAFISGQMARNYPAQPQAEARQPEQASYSRQDVDFATKLATAKLER